MDAMLHSSQPVHQFDGYTILKRRDGIVQVKFEAGFSIGIHDARNIVKIVDELRGKEKCLFMVVFEEDNTFTLETREFISSEAVSAIIKADAFVIKGLALEILGNGYLRINKPGRPTRLFKSVAIATMWLLSFVD